MGLLDSVFAGDSGIAAMLHDMLGGSIVIRKKNYSRNEDTGELVESYVDFPVSFVPSDANKATTNENAPGTGRSDVRIPSDEVSGTFPCSSLSFVPVANRDSLVINAVEYVIQTISTLKVGDSDVMYTLTAKRI